MKLLFDQDYVMEVYGKEREKLGEQRGTLKGAIQGTIETFQEVGKTASEVIHRLVVKFSLSQEEAEKYVHEFWKS